MRWDNLLAAESAGATGDAGEEAGTAVLPLFPGEAIVRRFETPQFRGLTFYEVAAKSIINHVPGDRFGFNWTINPYRGCSHACAYCLAGDTPILLADGRTKAIKDIAVGDLVYGTITNGHYQRYVPTPVLAHWASEKPAFRIRLEDGTQIIASGEHRFLTERGWKYVTGAECGPGRRPFLTASNRLIGIGQFGQAPKESMDYQVGYLCGMIRGDGTLGSYRYERPDHAAGNVHCFRLALGDVEALERTQRYLANLGVPTTKFLFQMETERRKPVHAIRAQSRSAIERIRSAIAWPEEPALEWTCGFLAGIFDAEGSFSGSLRIANADDATINAVGQGLRRLGLPFIVEDGGRPNRVRSVRLLGGLPSCLKFFIRTDSAITRKRTFHGQAVKSKARLGVLAVEPLGLVLPMYDITTGTGNFIANGVISHNCFARPTHTYLDFDAGRDFETKIVVKINAAELLRRTLRKPTWQGDLIAMGTNTDPYQRAEGHYKLMRGILRELNGARNPYSILTKGTLIQRDLDLLVEGAAVTQMAANFSVGTVDEEVWKRAEPGTPHPRKRLEVVAKLNEAGIPCGVLMAPILPGISDRPEQLEATVRAAAEAGATHITPITLHLRPGVKEEFLPWLAEHYPDLVGTYAQLYPKANAPKATGEAIGIAVAGLRRRYGASGSGPSGGRGPRSPAPVPDPAPPEPASEQLAMDLGTAGPRKAPGRILARPRGGAG
ncbi:MAG TPA: intein-containing Rv2578c family radical SAM protein [Actinomycetota bacterium]|nr:intein-containing Rv2578c family radical SAM protein [Actinomycetota bacterium]